MTDARSSTSLDRLVRAAAQIPVAEVDDRARLQAALLVGHARAQHATRRRSAIAALAATLLVTGGIALRPWVDSTPTSDSSVASSVPSASAAEAMSTISLGADDQMLVCATTRARVDSVTPMEVAIRLDDGAALFDVEPGKERRFSVNHASGTVTVRGTVFAVLIRGNDVAVRVYEGMVDVQSSENVRVVRAGEIFRSGRGMEIPASLDQHGRTLAEQRLATASRSTEGEWQVPEGSAPVSSADEATRERVIERTVARRSDPPSTTADVPRAASEAPETSRPARSGARRAPLSLAELRAMCARGEHAAVVVAMQSREPPAAEGDEWFMVLGDAQRGVGNASEAAAAYRRAASLATPSRAALAGFLAAEQWAESGEWDRALRALEETNATTHGAPVAERAAALELDALVRAGRTEDARRAASRYLAAFPGSPHARRALELLE